MTKVKKIFNRIKTKLRKKPLFYFGIVLGLLLCLIVLGNLLRKPEKEEEVKTVVKEIQTFSIGTAPIMKFQGKVEKSGTITILAQIAGIVNSVNVSPALQIYKGQTLLTLSSNYSGGNIPALQQQLAFSQYNFNKDNFDLQKELITKQKDLANKAAENSEDLREITRKSVAESNDQLSLNESILETLSQNLTTLEQATQSAATDALILSTKQLKSQFLAAVNQLKQLIRTNEYQGDDENPPADLTNMQKDLALKQLDLQEKSLDLSLEVSKLSWQISAVAASLMYPSSPFPAMVEKVHVYPGQFVSPGQPLVTLTGEAGQLDVVVSIPASISKQISKLEPAKIYLDGNRLEILPQHITLQPLLDKQHRIIYHLPLNYSNSTFDGQYLTVEIPLGYADSVATIPSIPIDAVHQLQDKAYVYLASNGTVTSKEIVLGKVLGSYVEILAGLSKGDLLIISRNVTEGDLVGENKNE
ncbi:efflux RND transporter periplasmic adaptor subunit [Patescibacteria group bacterium]